MSRQHPLVLLVAADGLTRRQVSATLEIYGHHVLTAADGREALALLGEHGVRIASIVVDVDIGGEVDGLTVAEQARRLNSKVAVIYTARRPHVIPASRQVPGSPVIRTPYHPHQLAGVITMVRQEPRAQQASGREAA